MKSQRSRRNRGRFRKARACGGKVAYDQASAGAAAWARTRRLGVRFNAYRCLFCALPSGAQAWHIGHAAALRRRLG